jgi:hypothetical protein
MMNTEISRFVVTRPVQQGGPDDKRLNRIVLYARTGKSAFASRVIKLKDPLAVLNACRDQLALLREEANRPREPFNEIDFIASFVSRLEHQDLESQHQALVALKSDLIAEDGHDAEGGKLILARARAALHVHLRDLSDELMALVMLPRPSSQPRTAALMHRLHVTEMIARFLESSAGSVTTAQLQRWLRARIFLPNFALRRMTTAAANSRNSSREVGHITYRDTARGSRPDVGVRSPVSGPQTDLPTVPTGIGAIGPKRRSDLQLIRQTLKRYEAGEIAHIENVLQGETQERTFSRADTTETSFLRSQEQVVVQERDLQSTERFEMAWLCCMDRLGGWC